MSAQRKYNPRIGYLYIEEIEYHLGLEIADLTIILIRKMPIFLAMKAGTRETNTKVASGTP